MNKMNSFLVSDLFLCLCLNEIILTHSMKITASPSMTSLFFSLTEKLCLTESLLILSLWLKVMPKTLLGLTVRWLDGGLQDVSKNQDDCSLLSSLLLPASRKMGEGNVFNLSTREGRRGTLDHWSLVSGPFPGGGISRPGLMIGVLPPPARKRTGIHHSVVLPPRPVPPVRHTMDRTLCERYTSCVFTQEDFLLFSD